VVVLEELEHAKARGAKIYAEVVGYGANSDGYDMVAPSGEGGQRCMKMAMAMANEIGGQKEVNYVNTHGTSTPVGDTMELGGIKKVFTEAGYMPYVGSTKSLSGHALGAAGVHEAIYSLLMVRDGFLAESANINDLVDEAEGMKILTSRVEGPVDRVMSNSFGFGGTNACLVFDRWTE
jgi:3-oxoacyl-[acyl-carrier-protein] synthase-1